MSIADVLDGRARWHVENADCLAVIHTLPDASVDSTITDPPYDEHTQNNIRSVYSSGEKRVKVWELEFPPLTDFSFVTDLLRVTKRWVVCFCALEQIREYREIAGDSWIRGGIWHKTMAAPQVSGDRPANSCEGVAIMHRGGKKRWNGGGTHAYWTSNPVRGDRLHPCEKPMLIATQMVSLFSDPDEVVFDPFCGSAAFGASAVRLGRRYVGVELIEKYSQCARERIAAEQSEITVSDLRSGQLGLLDKIGGAA